MIDASGNYVCVYNGETYNHQDIRLDLQRDGVHFRSLTDTEVVINLFARQGIPGVLKLNGMFAFAAWSKRTQELWLVRDPIGIKPLYYRLEPSRLTFASEIKAIRAADHTSDLDPRGLLNYLTYGHAISPKTIFQNTYKLPPGHYLYAKAGQVKVERYFTFPRPAEAGRGSAQDWVEDADEVLSAAVRRQMVADVPVGVFLSGGLDSSLVAAYMSDCTDTVKSFTISFPGLSQYDEASHARIVARRLGIEHNQIEVTENDVIRVLDVLLYHYDEPFADAAAIPFHLVSQFARQRVKVVLSGEGGDEMFGGYLRYSAERFATLYGSLPRFVKTLAIKGASMRPQARRLNRMVQVLARPDDAERYAAWLTVFSSDALHLLLDDLYRSELDKFDGAVDYRRHFDDCPNADALQRILYTDAQTWLPDTYLEKADKASMAVSLEVRVPLLDLDVVRFAANCPSNMKIRGHTTKYLLRRIAKSRLPSLISSKPKHGLSVPIGIWFRGKLGDFVREILVDNRTASRGLLSRRGVEALLDRHASGKENCETQLWTLLILELWMRQVADPQTAQVTEALA